ncbi:hypothetical protein XENOCAPTIV_029205, partial [Xenoophorus captivus]
LSENVTQLLPGPGEDIWKKFELLPTPPLSPSRTPPQLDHSLSAADHLEAVSELLDEDSNPSAAFLQSFIIQDCMWSSSFGAATKLEKVVSERLASLRARRDSSDTCSLTGGGSDPQVGRCQREAERGRRSDDGGGVRVESGDAAAQQQRQRIRCETGSCSFLPVLLMFYEVLLLSGVNLVHFSVFVSFSTEEEEEDGEEEEIDVVTVDRQRTSRRSDALPLVLKRSHINIQQHNYAAPQPAGKRLKVAESPATAKQSGGRRCWSPRSDGEDEDRRRTHNVLERQRRNELRMSFLALRDQIPAVANNDKAAKVVILKRATEFIREVGEDERRLLRKKDELTKRSRELKRRLEQLRTLH